MLDFVLFRKEGEVESAGSRWEVKINGRGKKREISFWLRATQLDCFFTSFADGGTEGSDSFIVLIITIIVHHSRHCLLAIIIKRLSFARVVDCLRGGMG